MLGFWNRPRRVTSPRRIHLSIETLEDRRLLATFSPLTTAVDGGPNSLRSAIISADENSEPNNTIVLQAGTGRDPKMPLCCSTLRVFLR